MRGTSEKSRNIPVVGSLTTLRPECGGDGPQLSSESTSVSLGVTLTRKCYVFLRKLRAFDVRFIMQQYALEKSLERQVFVVYWKPGGVA